MRLDIVEVNGWHVLSPKDRFFGIGFNRFREISVDNPADPFGDPIFEGPAWEASKYLPVGEYNYEWRNQDDLFYD
jgi:hypothetical protein